MTFGVDGCLRIAAIGDVHLDADVLGRYRPALEHVRDKADALLLAGDLPCSATTTTTATGSRR